MAFAWKWFASLYSFQPCPEPDQDSLSYLLVEVPPNSFLDDVMHVCVWGSECQQPESERGSAAHASMAPTTGASAAVRV